MNQNDISILKKFGFSIPFIHSLSEAFCTCNKPLTPGQIPVNPNLPDKIEFDVSVQQEGGDPENPNTQLQFDSLKGCKVFVFFNNQVVPETSELVPDIETYNWNPLSAVLTKFLGFHEDEHITIIPYKK